jgi:uncharacterized protein YqhQ
MSSAPLRTTSETGDDREEPRLQLAGMALRNGVLVLGPTHWAVAVREPDGSLHTHAQPRPSQGEELSARVPLLRGPVRLANMLRVLPQVRRSVPQARLALESRGILAGMLAGSLATGMVRRNIRSAAVGELAAGALSLAITIASMRTGEVAAYHGAEHKAIGGYEQGIAAAEATREHARCGTQLALPMLAFGAIGTQGALALAPRNPRLARTVGQLVGVAAATELFRAGARGKGTALAVAAAHVGLKLQTHATTVEPDAEQLAVAEAALAALLEAEERAAA